MTSRVTPASSPLVTRRTVLGLLAGAGVATGLAACQVQVNPDAGAGAGAPPIELPDSGAKLPSDQAQLRWMDDGNGKQLFNKPLFEAYQAKHENIKVHYDQANVDHINESVPLGVRNGSAPDVFQMPTSVPARTAVSEGWVQPIDQYIPDFDAWLAAFPDNTLVPNTHIINGKVYSFPRSSSATTESTMVADTQLFDRADLSPDDIKTWDDLRNTTKKLTSVGAGESFGLMCYRSPSKIVKALGLTKGWAGGLDPRTGEYDYTSDTLLDAIELVQAIHADGSLFPDFAGISAADSRGRMPNGVCGLIFEGTYAVPDWNAAEWEYSFHLAPTPTGDPEYYEGYTFGNGANTYLFAGSKLGAVAGDLYSYIGSLEGQKQIVIQSGGALQSLFPEAMDDPAVQAAIQPTWKKIRELQGRILRVAPSAAIRNEAAADVELARKSTKPGFADILGGMLTGQVSDVKKALTEFESAENKDLDNAIATVQKSGGKITRDDYVFPNWDPSKDYTQADYEAL